MELWIARDSDGLWLFKQKPIIDSYDKSGVPTFFWVTPSDAGELELDSALFPDVTFENRPQEVDITLKTRI